ncbi:MAG: apolipoprotein N-acyltransferase [Lautropia sp.]
MTELADPRIGRRAGVVAVALALLLGLAMAASFAPTGSWWFQLAVLAGFAAQVERLSRAGRGAAALAGGAFGFGWFCAGVAWLYVSMHTYGAMPAPLAVLALVLFACYLSSFPAVVAALAARWRPASPILAALRLAGLMTAAELLRGYLFTGFPWLMVGYAQIDGPLAGYAAIGGVQLVGFAAVFCGACIAAAIAGSAASSIDSAAGSAARAGSAIAARGAARPRRFAPLLSAVVVIALGFALGRIEWSEPAGTPLRIRLVQGNVPQQMKFEAATVLQSMHRYLELIEAPAAPAAPAASATSATSAGGSTDRSTGAPPELIVLPETAWTLPWPATPPDLAARLARFVSETGSAVAIGMPLVVPLPRPAGGGRDATTLSNSVLLLDRAAVTGAAPPARYDKRHLVPFGEFVPPGFRWFVDLMTIPLGDFARGTADQPPFAVGGQRIAFNICYEDAFGEELLPALQGPDGATILANVSNIAWFGDSHALPQHLQIARMRTRETARPMIRATNTGVTAAIDHSGRVIAQLPNYRTGAIDVAVQGRRGLTPYARTGNWPIVLLALVAVAVGVVAGRQRRPPRRTR